MKTTPQRGSLAHARSSPDYWTALAIRQFGSGLRRVMGSMKQKELAARLDVSESAVSQILNGAEDNLSLERMNRIAAELDAVVHVRVAARDATVSWEETPTGPLGALPEPRAESPPDTEALGTEILNGVATYAAPRSVTV